MEAFDPKLTLYIPHIFSNWADVSKIKNVFEKLDIGMINNKILIKTNYKKEKSTNTNYLNETEQLTRTYTVCKKEKKIYYQAYIFFNYWYDTHQNRNLQEKILNSNLKAKLIYDDPWYWILLKAYNYNNVINTVPNSLFTNNLYDNMFMNNYMLKRLGSVENEINTTKTIINNINTDIHIINKKFTNIYNLLSILYND